MTAPTLTPTEFRDFLGRSLQGFLDDWAGQDSTHPDVCREAMTGQDWLRIFSEFAVAEIVNPPFPSAIAEDSAARSDRSRGRP